MIEGRVWGKDTGEERISDGEERKERIVQSQMKDGHNEAAEERETRGDEEEKEGTFDYSRWTDYYCAAGKGWGGHRWTGGRESGGNTALEWKENNITPFSPVCNFPREEEGSSGREGIVAENVSVLLLLYLSALEVALSCIISRWTGAI